VLHHHTILCGEDTRRWLVHRREVIIDDTQKEAAPDPVIGCQEITVGLGISLKLTHDEVD